MSEMIFLGSGAADWKLSERNGFFRRNSAALLNKKLLIDCGSHIFDLVEENKCEGLYDGVTDVIVTHGHGDHFCKDSVAKLAQKQKICIGGNEGIIKQIGVHPQIEPIILKPFKEEKIGDYTIMPLTANHGNGGKMSGDISPLHFIIQTSDKKTIFYGLDGAWFTYRSWEEMKKYKFDVMVLDATVGDMDDWRLFEHNTIPMLRIMVNGIKKERIIKDGGIIIASHLARTLHLSHEKTAEIFKQFGVVTAFDTMNIVF